MNICIDFDDTLIYSKITKYASEILHYNFTRKDILTWDLEPFPKDLKELIYKMFKWNFYMNETIKPIKGSQEKVNEWINKGHKVYIITARCPEIRTETIDKVNELFPNITGLKFVGFNESKIGLLKDVKADVWIDDAPHGILDSLHNNISTIMICNEFTKYNWHLKDFTENQNFTIVDSVNDIDIDKITL